METQYIPRNGWKMLLLSLLILSCGIIINSVCSSEGAVWALAIGIPLEILAIFLLTGLFVLNPNTAVVLTFVGNYKGTVKVNGFHWRNPFFKKQIISLKVNNLNGNILKVNDKSGNPIDIAAAAVWKVSNTARAAFDVNSYHNYVRVQYESALRSLAMNFAYETTGSGEVSLREGHEEVEKFLMKEMHCRMAKAGIEIEEAKITTLGYSSEIAASMLRSQQAMAVIAAKDKIVQGAVRIIVQAFYLMRINNIVEMDREDKVRLITNLLIVLCSEATEHTFLPVPEVQLT